MSYKSINKTLKYSIRKLAVGATPVVIGTFLLAGGTTALASEGSGSNVSINYVADSELTDYEKSLVKQGIPEELKNGETYYLVYKNESYLQKNKLPDTGSTSLPLKGIGFATALLTVVLVSKKNRNKILGIVLIGALGQSVVLPSSTFALENKLLAGYNHITSANTRFEDNLISIDGYKYVGYLTSDDVSLNSVNTQEYHIRKSIVKTRSTDNKSDEGRGTTKPIEKDIENKHKVKENLTDVVKNSDDNIPLPVVVEEVLSETTKEEEIEVSDNENNNSSVEKDTSIEKKTNSKAPVVNNATLENEKEKSQTNVNAPIDKSNLDKSNIKEKTNIKASKSSEENTTIKNNTVETPKNIQDTTKSQKDTATATSNKANSSLTTDGVKPTKVKKKVKVVERIIKVTETIPYKVVYEEDENMENGTTKVIKEGSVGEKVTIQKVQLHNGEELKREVTSSTVKQKEVDKVIKVGTKGVKKHNSKQEINNDSQSAQKTKLIPKKETVYTEIVESKQRKYVKDYPKLEEATKNIKNNIGILTTQKDKLSTINITNIFDDSLFEGERRFENVMMYYVQANLKRKREFENQEEIIDNIITKEVPVITGVMRIGTRKPGFETLKGDGKLVNISSNLDEKEIKNIKLSNNKSYMFDKEVPGYLGSAINVDYEKDFKNTTLGMKFDVENLKADSEPTIYRFDQKTQLDSPIDTKIIGNIAYGDIKKPGIYSVRDKHKQDEIRKTASVYVQNESQVYDDKISNGTSQRKKSVVFALDSSGSMKDNDGDGLRKKLTKSFIKRLNPENDKISIIDFDHKIHKNKPLSNNFLEALADVDSVNDEGGTNIYAAIVEGIKILNSEKEGNSNKYLFLLTDGKDDLGFWEHHPTDKEYDEIIEEAIKNKITIYTIGFQSVDEDLLKRIADRTGGKAYLKNEAAELPEIFDQLNEEIKNRDTDINKDGISAHYTKEILTEKLLLSTLRKSPYYKNQIEKAREKIANDFGIAKTDIEAINKKIESIEDNKYIEGLLNPDYDNDKLLNGNEARPEKDSYGNAFLYVLSDPENPDTDDDGEPDNIDKYTDFDKNNGTYLKLTSNVVDSDGDGYDDAFEERSGNDSFNIKFDSKKWNVGERDLLLFSVISYLKDNHKNKIEKLKDIFEKENIDRIDMTHFKELKLQETDNNFFENWRFVDALNEKYDSSLEDFNSNVSWYYNENNKALVIAYRGTDENNTDFTFNSKFEYKSELINDLKILLNISKIEEMAKKQIQTIISKTKDLNIENIYVTGHSLGGYEAYYGALELSRSSVSSKFRGGLNFNGPGIHATRTEDIEGLSKLLVKSIYNDKISLNSLIVFGGLPSNEPLNKYERERLEELFNHPIIKNINGNSNNAGSNIDIVNKVSANLNHKLNSKNVELAVKLFQVLVNNSSKSSDDIIKSSVDILVDMLISGSPVGVVKRGIDALDDTTKIVNTVSLITKGILKHPESIPVEESYLKPIYTSKEDREKEEKDLLRYSHDLTSFFGKLSQGNIRTSESKFETSTNKLNSFLNSFSKISAKVTGRVSSIVSPINEAVENMKKYISNKVTNGIDYLKSIF